MRTKRKGIVQKVRCGILVGLATVCAIALGASMEMPFLRSVAWAASTTWYISPTGGSSAAGSQADPFGEWSDVWNVIKPGDTLVVTSGTYYPQETIIVPSNVGSSSGNPITITGERGASIDGSKMPWDDDGTKCELMKIKGDHITVENLAFCNSTGDSATAIRVYPGADSVTIKNNEIYNIQVTDATTSNHTGVNCIMLFGDDPSKAITNTTITGNYIHDCNTGYCECITAVSNVTNTTISNNIIKNTGNIGIDIAGNYGYCSDPSLDFARNTVVSGNTVSNCVSPFAVSYGIYTDGSQYTTVSGNTVTGCSGGVEVGSENVPSSDAYATAHITVTDNILTDNTYCSIAVGGYQTGLGSCNDINVTNNTCVMHGNTGSVLTVSKANGVTITGNTFQDFDASTTRRVVNGGMSSSYTKNITMEDNVFYAPSPRFKWYGTYYYSFDEFNAVAGGKTGVYSADAKKASTDASSSASSAASSASSASTSASSADSASSASTSDAGTSTSKPGDASSTATTGASTDAGSSKSADAGTSSSKSSDAGTGSDKPGDSGAGSSKSDDAGTGKSDASSAATSKASDAATSATSKSSDAATSATSKASDAATSTTKPDVTPVTPGQGTIQLSGPDFARYNTLEKVNVYLKAEGASAKKWEVSSVTLANGTKLTDPAMIAQLAFVKNGKLTLLTSDHPSLANATAVVKATAGNGDTAEHSVKVSLVTQILVCVKNDATLVSSGTIGRGRSLQLSATIQPTNEVTKDVTWTAAVNMSGAQNYDPSIDYSSSTYMSLASNGKIRVTKKMPLGAVVTVTAVSIDGGNGNGCYTATVVQ